MCISKLLILPWIPSQFTGRPVLALELSVRCGGFIQSIAQPHIMPSYYMCWLPAILLILSSLARVPEMGCFINHECISLPIKKTRFSKYIAY